MYHRTMKVPFYLCIFTFLICFRLSFGWKYSTRTNATLCVNTDHEIENATIAENRTSALFNSTSKRRTFTSRSKDGYMSKETLEFFFDIQQYLLIGFIILGLICNIFNIVVFSRKEMLSPTTRILTFLSCSELCQVLTAVVMISAKQALHNTQSWLYLNLIRFVRMYFGTVLQRSCFCFNVLVAIERFIAIAFPLKSRILRFGKRPVLLCVICLLLNLAYHIYNPLRVEIVAVCGRPGWYKLQKNKLLDEYVIDALNLIGKICFAFIPLCGCLVLNTFLLVALKRQTKQTFRSNPGIYRRNRRNRNRREKQTTATILVSTYIFVLLALPVTFTSVISSALPEFAMFRGEHNMYYFVTTFAGLLMLASLSVDFFIYLSMSKAFRTTFVRCLRSAIRCPSRNIDSVSDVISLRTVVSELDSRTSNLHSAPGNQLPGPGAYHMIGPPIHLRI